jgi:GxxExxY protein
MGQIANIAAHVYEKLGSGYSEEVYHRSMQVGLRLAGVRYDSKRVVELQYEGYYVGEAFPDLVVVLDSDKIVVELKAVMGVLGHAEEQQLRNYMDLLGVERGLLINFQQPGKKQGVTKLEVRELKPKAVDAAGGD